MISIIIPSLNPGLTKIINTLECILSNNGDYEVILILQGTPSSKICSIKESFNGENKLVVCIDDGIGISRARNIGIKSASGNWILLLDDDIRIDANAIATLESNLSCNDEFYYGNAMVANTNTHYVPFYLINSDISIWNYNRICSISFIISKGVFNKIGMFDECLGVGKKFGSSEESDLLLRAVLSGIRVSYMKDYVVYHEAASYSASKVYSYAMGAGALCRKFIAFRSVSLKVKFLIDIVIRVLFLATFKKKRYIFLAGFIKGFREYRFSECR